MAATARLIPPGAIEDMNALLLGGGSENFLYMSAVPETPEYVVLIDADSVIAPGGIKRAVAAMMHPLAASVDLMAFTCRYKVSTVTTLHGRAFLNESGEERYCASDDFYYDLCGRSVFCGKGIYRLKSFAEKLRGALPEGRVLSHDIAEGALTHTASAGECVYEDVPPTYAADVSRKRRWQRGDLLLLPLAFSSKAIHPLYRGVVLRNFFEILRPCALLAAIIVALCLKEVALVIVSPCSFSPCRLRGRDSNWIPRATGCDTAMPCAEPFPPSAAHSRKYFPCPQKPRAA